MSSVLMVITARGGSKSVPRKNLAPAGGKPLIWWTVAAAKGAAVSGRIIISTDDQEIATAVQNMGVEAPFLRPAELARDDTPGAASVVHAARWLEEHEGYRPDYVMHLQPTSPLRTAEDIDGAVDLAEHKAADAVVSVTLAADHPYWMKSVGPDGRMRDYVNQEKKVENRQALPEIFALNGAIYLARREVLLEDGDFYGRDTYAYVMPEERSLDVDTPWDLHLADLVLRERSTP